jgi:iron complex outermembrane recepter protein
MMSTLNKKKSLNRSSRSELVFKLNPIAAACAFAIFSAGSVYAQQADQDAQKVEGVIVTGIRKGIEDAISVKKNATSIVEAVSAEDIGKLPDTSIAESIARLPGVAAQRAQGRAQQISIRGTPADFASGLLNGREQTSTGDSRAVEFDQYPSELFGSVIVYKTADGSLLGQGLSGTIDQRTVRPLDFPKRAISVNYRKQKLGVGTGDAEGDGKRISLSYIDQFADRRIGLALGFARLDETSGITKRFESWGSTGYNSTPIANPDACGNDKLNPPAPRTAACIEVPNGFNSWTDQTKQKRDGTMAVVQFKPNKEFSSTLDLFYSKFESDKATKGFQAPVRGGAGGYDRDGNLSGATLATAGNGNVYASAGTFDNFKGVVRNDTTGYDDKLTSIGWENKLKLNEAWTGTLDLSKSTTKRTGAILETTAGIPGDGINLGTISWTGFDGNNVQGAQYTPTPSYADRTKISLTDVQGWGGGPNTPQAGYSKIPNVNDDLKAVRLSAKRDLPEGWMFSAADFGVNLTDREKTRAYIEGRLEIPVGGPFAATTVPGSGTAIISGIPIATWDPRGSIGSIYRVAAKLVPDIANKDWTVKEKINTFYTKLDIDSKMASSDTPVRGNVGLQVITADQSSTAFNADGRTCPSDACAYSTVTSGTKYTDILPSMNLAFDIGRDQTVRFAMAREVARPNLNDMRGSLNFSVDTNLGILKGSGGNPKLEPFRANAVDLSYEKYFGTKAYWGAAAFYKKLETYILKRNEVVNFAQYVTANTPLPVSGDAYGLLERPINGSNGNLKGIELSASIPFNLMTTTLDGFGAQASYSRTLSSVSLPPSSLKVDSISSDIALPGLSKNVANLTLYFEKSGFSVRVSERYRSDFVGEVTDFVGDRQLTTIKAEKIRDAQLSYEFQSGPVKGLSLLLQANNLSDTPYIRYKDKPANEIENTTYGKTYFFGLNYKL